MKWLVVGLVLVFLAYVIIKSQGQKIHDLTGQLADTTTALSKSRSQAQTLDRSATRLRQDSANLSGTVANLKLSEERALNRANQARQGQDAALSQVDQVVATMDALQRKKAADVPTAGVGRVATTVADTSLNGDVGKLKGKYRYLNDTLVPQLSAAVATQTERGDREEKRANTAEKRTSDLENMLNGYNGKAADYMESVTKPVLNIGYGKRVKRAAENLRAGRIDLKQK